MNFTAGNFDPSWFCISSTWSHGRFGVWLDVTVVHHLQRWPMIFEVLQAAHSGRLRDPRSIINTCMIYIYLYISISIPVRLRLHTRIYIYIHNVYLIQCVWSASIWTFHLGWVHSCQLCSHSPSLAAEWNNTLRLYVPVLSGCLEVMKHSGLRGFWLEILRYTRWWSLVC